MPRLTRRSAASKEEAAPDTEESPKTTTRGRRGGKKEEPKPEEAAIDEPAEGSSKRGGRQAKGKQAETKEATPKKGKSPASGRATSRSKRGNKQEESEEEPEQEQEEEEEAEEEQPKGGTRSRGKGGKAPAKGGRGSKKSEEETKEPEKEKTEADEENVEDTAEATGAKGKNKAAATTPSPRGGRKGRGKAGAEQTEEEQEDSKNGKEEEATDAPENEIGEEPKARQKRTPNQTTTPPSGGRRSRGQKAPESSTKTPPARSSRRGGSAPAEVENKEKEGEEEPMEEEVKPEEETKPQEEVPAAKEQDSPSKKRKLEEEEEETEDRDLKRQKVDEGVSAEESKEEAKEDELVDYVVVSKEDVPAPDSKEVVESFPPLVPPENESEQTAEAKPFTQVEMAEATFVVPLTEAELAKQYAPQQKQDVDETSSTLVEVGSEAASDITGLSRGLDFSDAVSLDSSVSADQPMEVRPDNPLGTPDKDQAPEFAEVAMEKEASAEDDDPVPVVEQVAEGELTTEKIVNLNHSEANDCNNSATIQSLDVLKRNFLLNPLVPAELMDPAYCFSVVSYNILADCHLRRGDYSYREPRFLDKDYRHFVLMKELDYLNGDIVCLQEVNPTYYQDILLPAMASRGYEGSFIKRTKNYWDEGAATFVKKNKFSVVSFNGISLGELAHKGVDSFNLSPEISEAAKQYLDRADVILLTQVKLLKTSQLITVCNIHVVYDVEALDVQCIQVACAVKELVSKAGSDLNPHIICGDFNSIFNSPAYQLARDGYLIDSNIKKLQGIQALKVSTDSSKSLVNQMWGAFQHTSSNLQSAYNVVMRREPLCTTYTKSSYATLDYIFYSSLSLDVVGVLETIDDKAVRSSGGLPTSTIPSDHLSLKAVFRPRVEKE